MFMEGVLPFLTHVFRKKKIIMLPISEHGSQFSKNRWDYEFIWKKRTETCLNISEVPEV